MDTPMQPEVVLSEAELVFRELQTLRQQVQVFEAQQRQTQQANVAAQQELGTLLQQKQQEALQRSADALQQHFTGEYTGNAEDRWIFINDSLAGPIRKRVSHFFANGRSHGWEAQTFLDHLAVLYEDPRYEDRARLELLTFQQEKKEKFSEF
ncbi:uncharacterized protein CPUR_04263 [Claviceps purpurea 20.1]|uniref:Uncharacterized protein n=1 Tax=Claviceps purpurea (strain 20.1) TaxID=1111077 RepID=M1W6B2_CLAP2|nr:uncharacterized protein CPUR_04263 [Claviceps purpurea 20.1]